MRSWLGALSFGMAVSLLMAIPVSDLAAQPGTKNLAIELNKIEPAGDTCRISFVVTNRSASRYDELLADLVFFDTDGVIATRATLNLGPMRAEKTQVVSFPIDSLDCSTLGRVLLNEMVSCSPPPGESFDCTRMVELEHRGPVAFEK